MFIIYCDKVILGHGSYVIGAVYGACQISNLA